MSIIFRGLYNNISGPNVAQADVRTAVCAVLRMAPRVYSRRNIQRVLVHLSGRAAGVVGRPMREITHLVIHRSENGHTGKELATVEPGAYHLYVLRDGSVDWAFGQGGFDLNFELKGAHAVGWNARSIGIAVQGCFTLRPDGKLLPQPPKYLHPTEAQLDTLDVLCRGLSWWFGKALFLNGHTELPGSTRFAGKVCPGECINMDGLRCLTGLKSHSEANRLIPSL